MVEARAGERIGRSHNLEQPFLDPKLLNNRRRREVGLSCCGGYSNARSLARLYGAVVNGGKNDSVRLLSLPTVAPLLTYCEETLEGDRGWSWM
jgi:hypothetical protein